MRSGYPGGAVAVGLIVVAAALICGVATRVLIVQLARRNILDRPNDRSSHRFATPRGAGIAVVATVLAVWLGLAAIGRVSAAVFTISIAAGLLAAISWLDDLDGLSPITRLVAQAAAIAIGLTALPADHIGLRDAFGPVLPELVLGLLWLWWVNAFNFMDGIDGLAGSEAAAIGAGLLLLGSFGAAADPTLALLAAAVLGAALGFLRWNWAPARIFLGDVGSVPLGYLTGFLLLSLAEGGNWAAALILPLYFLADATITLVRRLLRGERVWQAHREHFYQRAVARGADHAAVVTRVAVANTVLVLCGWAAANGAGVAALAAAIASVAALLAVLVWG